jgi:hypothetical protein
MDVCVVLYGSMEHDMKDEKDLIKYKNGSKGKNPGQTKKNPRAGLIFFLHQNIQTASVPSQPLIN